MSDAEFAPLALSPKKTAVALDIGLTRIYELINSGELESYLDGGSRKITTASIRRYQAERLAAGKDASPDIRRKIDKAIAARHAGDSPRRKRGRPAGRSTAGVR